MMAILTLPLWAQSLIFLAGPLLLVGGLRLLFNRHPSSVAMDRAREAAGILRQPTTTIVALTLALSGAQVVNQLHQAQAEVAREANALMRVHRDTLAVDTEAARDFRRGLRAYVDSIVHEEWPAMTGDPDLEATAGKQDALFALFQPLRPEAPHQQIWLNDIVTQLNVAADLRRVRIANAQDGMPWVFYAVAIGGAVVVLSYAALLPRSAGSPMVMASYALVIGLTLLLVVSLDLPYSGAMGVRPDVLEALLASWPVE